MRNNKIKIFLFTIVIAIISIFSISYATEQDGQKLITSIEESDEHKAWSELSDEEKAETIEPAFNSTDLINSVLRSTYNALTEQSTTVSTLSSSYDLRDALENIIVKNQMGTGSCWAFSGSTVVETSIAKTYSKTSTEYSPMHISYYTASIYNMVLGSGGNHYLLQAYLANGYGPVYESDLSFESVYDASANTDNEYGLLSSDDVDFMLDSRAKVNDTTMFAAIYKSYDESTGEITYTSGSSSSATTYTDEEVEAIRELIKQHIQEDGAIYTTIYSDIQVSNGNYTSAGGYYNADTCAWYYNGSEAVNHAVTIVGWDDNYSKTNFAEGNQPANDGAYIVLNSYGETFGESGYMYISYDDAGVEQWLFGIDSITEYSEETKDYDIQYTHSELGMDVGIEMVNDSNTQYLSEVYAANVYQREDTTEDEYLTKVGLYIYETEGVEIYINTASSSLDDLTLVASYTGSNALTPGYHTLDITDQELTGEEFVIAVKYIKDDEVTGGVTLPLECNPVSCNITTTSNFFDTIESQEGESFVSQDGETWVDLYGYNYAGLYTLIDTNACIDAYTDVQETVTIIDVTGISLDKTSTDMNKDATLTLVATITPEDATNQNITWSSSDEDIATVSQSGVVTAKAVGEVTITVTTEDGGYSASCDITVGDIVDPPVLTISVTGVTLNKSSETLTVGQTLTLTATVTPEYATNQNITWSSSDESVATVSGGVVTALSEGKVTITVTTEDGGYTDICEITVESATTPVESVEVTSVSLNTSNVAFEVGDVYTLVATLNPSDATNKNVTWSSSNTSVVTVSDTGIITAVAEGTAVITVTTEDGGYTASATVTVSEKTNTDDDIYTDSDDNNGSSSDTGDNTVISATLPQTGEQIMIIGVILILLVIGTVCIIKVKSQD